ncbi:MAG: hypothetical protein LBU03_01800 [Tannerellaceae bacterium]|jgi:hypothetical protein|nr:hypothetical protein [Tannerellaceae bacterium]
MYGNALRFSCMYDITEKWSTGLGIGADRYENPGYNTFPVFVPVHFHPFIKSPNWYALTNIGYALKGAVTDTGLTWDIGAGYKKMFRKHVGVKFQLGYNLKQFNNVEIYSFSGEKEREGTQTRHSLFFGVGYIF